MTVQTCTVSGILHDAALEPLTSLKLTFKRVGSLSVIDGQKAVAPQFIAGAEKTVVTHEETGAWSINLAPGYWDMSFWGPDGKTTVRVPVPISETFDFNETEGIQFPNITPSILTKVNEAIATAADAGRITGGTATALPAGSDPTVTISGPTGAQTLNLGLPVGAKGDKGDKGDIGNTGASAYEVAVAAGFVGDQAAWLASLHGADGTDGTDGTDGDSAYQIAVASGFVGDEAAWLVSLNGSDGADGADGADGDSGYQVAVANGFVGDEAAWLASLHGSDGANGASAYEVAVAEGFVGDEAAWLASLQATGMQGANNLSEVTAPETARVNLGIPANVGHAGMFLRQKVDETGLEFAHPLNGLRNLFVNGRFDFWQRGISFSSNQYGADRWINGKVGNTTVMSHQSFALGQTDVPGNPLNYCRMTVTPVAGASNYSVLAQRIEYVWIIENDKLTVSFWARADAPKDIAIEVSQYFGSGGSPSNSVLVPGQTITLGTTWAKHTATFNIPSLAGKTIGTNADSYLVVNFFLSCDSDFDARTNNLGQQSGVFDFAMMQAERGPVATPFDYSSIALEFIRCARYYLRSGYEANQKRNVNWGGATWPVAITVDFPVIMARTPSISVLGDINDGAEIALGDAGIASTPFGFTAFTNVSTGQYVDMHYYIADAEL